MSSLYLGQLLSVLAPLLWAVAVILFRLAGQSVQPVALNLFKNWSAFILLALTLALMGEAPWAETSAFDLALLLSSGVVGIALADSIFFYALNRLGAGRMAIVGCSYMPAVLLLSFLFLDDRLSLMSWLGAALVLGGIVLTSVQRAEPGQQGLLGGVALGILSMVLMAVGVIVAKPALDHQPLVWASTIRLAGGALSLGLYSVLHPQRRLLLAVFRPSPAWRILLPASVAGTYLAYLFWLGGMKYAPVSVAAILNQLNAIFVTVLAALFLGERLTARKGVSVALAVLGSVAVVMG